MNTDADLERLAKGSLQEHVAAEFSRSRSRVLVGLRVGTSESYAATGAQSRSAPSEQLFHTGCLSKLITASLLRRAARERAISLEAQILPLLDRKTPRAGLLAGVNLRHLMEHTHGLDASGIESLPYRSDGLLDGEAFLSSLSGVRISPPGALYSYGHTGAWLAAILLEQLEHLPYAQVLERRFHLNHKCKHDDKGTHLGPACPATGGSLAVRLCDYMRFLREEMRLDGTGLVDRETAAHVYAKTVPRAGWNAFDQGNYRGWSYYGSGWFGHTSVLPGTPAAVRINPARQIAVVIASDGLSPQLAASRLFARLMPGLLPKAPRRLTDKQARELDLTRYEAHYGDQRTTFRTRPGPGLTISIEAHYRGPVQAHSSAAASLHPAENEAFVAKPPDPCLSRFYQFLHPMNGGFQYLWDGESLYPRLTEGPDSRCRQSPA